MPKPLSLKAKVSTQSNKNSGWGNEWLSLGGNEGSWKTQMKKWTHAVAPEVSSLWGISRKGSLGNTQKICLFPSPASPKDVVPVDKTMGWWGGSWLCTARLGCRLFWKQGGCKAGRVCSILNFLQLGVWEQCSYIEEQKDGAWVMCSETGKEGKRRGKPVDVIETALQIKPGRHGPTGNAGGVPASASRNGFSVAMGMCCSPGSPALNLPCVCSQLISAPVDQFSICS